MNERRSALPVVKILLYAFFIVAVIIPLFTKPTTMTVLAELDCNRNVTTAPTSMARNFVPVATLTSLVSLLPARACMPSDMKRIPSKKIPRPPKTV